MDKVIQRPLTKTEVSNILQFLSYHLNYTPVVKLQMIFAETPQEFARLYDERKSSDPSIVRDINQQVPAFFDHINNRAVFQGFSYINGISVPQFIIPMSTIFHEAIHFFQYATGQYGIYQTLYEGTNEILSCFFVDDYEYDYREEAQFAFNLAMELNGRDFWEAINWIKRYTTHSEKTKFVVRSMLQCPTFSKFRPTNLLRWLDQYALHKIKNEDVRAVFTRYSVAQIRKLCAANRKLIS